MISKQFRFHGRESVVRTLRKGELKKGRWLAVRLTDGRSAQLAIVVSKKIDKRAAVRNTIRRRISAAVRPIIEQPGFNKKVVVIAKNSELADCDFKELEKELDELLAS